MTQDFLAHLPVKLPLEQMLGEEGWERANYNAKQYWFDIDDFDERGHRLALDFNRKMERTETNSLLILSVGKNHLGQLYRALVYKGYEPHFVLSDTEELGLLAQTIIKYHLQSVEKAVPAILIGDTSGKDYEIPLPESESLKEQGIRKIRFFPQQLVTRDGRVYPFQLGIETPRGRFSGNPAYMHVLDRMDEYAAAGICTSSEFLVGHSQFDGMEGVRLPQVLR